MKTKSLLVIYFFILYAATSLSAHAQNTTFTYQGRVTNNGTNFNGAGQFKFALVTSTNFSHQATATANPPSGGFITIINVTFGGSGYVTPPTVTVSGGGGSGVIATASISGGVVTGITVNNPGSGYASTPTVTVAPPPPNIVYTTYWSNDGTSVNGSEPAAAVGVSVSSGLFTVRLGDTTIPNMAAISAVLFTQPNLQLRMWFNDGINGFAALNPPQSLTPSPYAVQALNANTAATAASANSVAAANITGTVLLSQVQGGVITNNQSGVNLSGVFTGNGGALSNLSANSLVLVSTNNSISSWGWNEYGQRNVPAGLDDVLALASGAAHSLALRANGTVVAWGAGKTNNPSSGSDYGQSLVPVGLSNVTNISAGYLHSLALRNNGTVVAWGAGTTNDPNTSLERGQAIVPGGLNNVTAIAAGVAHSLALRNNGTVVAWGAGTTINTNELVEAGQSIVPAGLSNVVAVSAGYVHSLALRANGTVVAWGAGTTNAGTGVDWGQSIVPAGLSNVIAVAAGGIHSLALRANGTVVAWGAGTTNDPMDGINFGQSILPAGLSNVVAIAPGLYHSLVLKSDGTVAAWGGNQYGQTNVPAGLNNVVALASGSVTLHGLVLRKRSTAPVAWLDSDNTFNGNIQINGGLQVSGDTHIAGEITAGAGFRLSDSNLWLRAGSDKRNGLGWYGPGKNFGSFYEPDGPVLFGSAGGMLGTTTNFDQVALTWNSSQQVGIGTATPSARLSLGGDAASTKLLLRDDGDGSGIGMGAIGSQFRFHLSGNAFDSFSFRNNPTGNEVFAIAPNGTVRLGPTAQYFATAGTENLRILRGRISGAGGITTGTGFTVAKTGTGAYTVTFTTSFTSEPTVTATPQVGLARIATCTNVGTGSAQFRTFDSVSGAAVDQDFHFIIIGPR